MDASLNLEGDIHFVLRKQVLPAHQNAGRRCFACAILHLFVDKPALFAYDKGNTENCVKLAVKRRVRTVCA